MTKFSKHSGFTLIELLVAMAIVGILAGTAIVNFGKNEDRDVRMEKDRLTSFLREVQNKALAGDKMGISTTDKICGFGAYLDSGNLQVYYASVSGVDSDCSATSAYDASKTMSDKFIPRNGVSLTSSSAYIFFVIPNGDVGCGGCALPVTISITKGSSTDVNVKIDDAGRIY